MIEITDDNFQEEIAQATMPAVVDFWAPWCGPCRAIGPMVEDIAEEFAGKAVFGSCNCDEVADLPFDYNIRNLPTILFFKDGKVQARLVGNVTREEILAELGKLQ